MSAAISCSRSDLVGSGFQGVAAEVLHAGIGPGGLFDLLFLEEHLGGGLEALVLEETLDQFAARVFGVAADDVAGIARKEGLRLDVDQERGHVDELAGGVDVDLLEVLGVVEKLAGDAGDGNVVDVDVLLADEVEQKIERAVVDLADGDGEGRLRGLSFLCLSLFLLRRVWLQERVAGACLKGERFGGFARVGSAGRASAGAGVSSASRSRGTRFFGDAGSLRRSRDFR